MADEKEATDDEIQRIHEAAAEGESWFGFCLKQVREGKGN